MVEGLEILPVLQYDILCVLSIFRTAASLQWFQFPKSEYTNADLDIFPMPRQSNRM